MFNKSEIMRRAWAIVKKGSEWQTYRLRYALQDAWGDPHFDAMMGQRMR